MNAKTKEPEALTFWAKVEEPKKNNGIQVVAEIKNANNLSTFITINTTFELDAGENLLIIKKSDTDISNVTSIKDYTSSSNLHTASSSNLHTTSKGGWIAMLKKQIRFMLISISTILLSLAGFIFFLISKSTIIYPTIYLIMFFAGLGWLLTAIKGLSDVLKRG